MFDRTKERTAAAGSVLESDCPRKVQAARRTWQQELPGVGTGTTSEAQYMVCLRLKVRAERHRGPGAAAGMELERSS